MKTFEQFLSENKKIETAKVFNPAIEKPTTETITKPRKKAKVFLQNQVEEEMTTFKMAPSHIAYSKKGKPIRVPKGKAITVSRSSSKGD